MGKSIDLKPADDVAADLDMTPFDVCEKNLKKRVASGKIPGYCSAVVYKGRLLRADSCGYADPTSRLKYGPDVIMRLYCMTKPFVAVAFLKLQERGLVSMKDPVEKYIPAFRGVSVVASSKSVFTKSKKLRPTPGQFTLEHCLTHTAGLPYGSGFNFAPESPEEHMCNELVVGVEEGSIKSLGNFIDELSKLPLRLMPGKEYRYSYGLDIVGRVIEIASGMKLSKFMEKELFKPLRMHDTAFSFPRSKAKRVAAIYCNRTSAKNLGMKASELPNGKHALCRFDGKKPQDSVFMEGNCSGVESGGGFQGSFSGGCVSTVNDCTRFVAMLCNFGELDGVRILQECTVKRWCLTDLFPHVIPSGKVQRAAGKPYGWSALGEVGIPRTARDPAFNKEADYEVGETGGGGAACTYWSVNPTRDMAIVWFTQICDNEPYEKDNENPYVAARTVCPLNHAYKPYNAKLKAKKAQASMQKKKYAQKVRPSIKKAKGYAKRKA